MAKRNWQDKLETRKGESPGSFALPLSLNFEPPPWSESQAGSKRSGQAYLIVMSTFR
jgi:hypothetical protein